MPSLLLCQVVENYEFSGQENWVACVKMKHLCSTFERQAMDRSTNEWLELDGFAAFWAEFLRHWGFTKIEAYHPTYVRNRQDGDQSHRDGRAVEGPSRRQRGRKQDSNRQENIAFGWNIVSGHGRGKGRRNCPHQHDD